MSNQTLATLSGTAWIVEIGLRVTLFADGLFRDLASMTIVDIDPTAVTFVTDRTVGNLAAHDGKFTIRGGECSPTRLATLLAASPKSIDKVYTLAELAAHPHLGKGWTAEYVIDSYKAESN